jgi:SAM-dependent methyltransferase
VREEKRESIAEFGTGYGTFTIPAAKRTSGVVYTFDIEPELVTLVRRRARELGLSNIRVEVRDFVAQGTGLPSRSIDHAMLYNLLHVEEPVWLLKEAFCILKPARVLSIIHWKYNSTTPRGPSMGIRPRPEQCPAWAEAAGFKFVRDQDLSACCHHHYGMLLVRPHAKGRQPNKALATR